MHFTVTVSLGDIAVFATCLITIFFVGRQLNWILIEHELLMRWYADSNQLKLEDLPTRIRTKMFTR